MINNDKEDKAELFYVYKYIFIIYSKLEELKIKKSSVK